MFINKKRLQCYTSYVVLTFLSFALVKSFWRCTTEDIAPVTSLSQTLQSIKFSSRSTLSCGEDIPFMLIIVHSSPRHFLYRSTIRKTWASFDYIWDNKIRVIFLVGETDQKVQNNLNYEMQTFKDIVQGNFIDSYKNLTYKHLMGYQWTLINCKSASLVLKTDDDVFVDVFRAVSYLRRTFGAHPVNLLSCLIIPTGSSTKRSGKWLVSKQDYPLETYPEYCSGMAYVVTPDAMEKILTVSADHPFFWIDDVLLTGLLANKARLKRTDLSVWYATKEHWLLDWLHDNVTRPSPWMFTELTPINWPDMILSLWKKTLKAWRQ